MLGKAHIGHSIGGYLFAAVMWQIPFSKVHPPLNMTGQPANNGWLYPAGAGAAGSGAGSGAGSEGLGSGGAGAGGLGAKAPPTQAQLQMVRWCRRGKVDDALFVVGWQGPLETREGQARGGAGESRECQGGEGSSQAVLRACVF